MAAILTILLPFYPEGKGLVVSGRLQQHRRTYYEKERRWLWVDRTGLPVLSGDFTSPNWWNLFIKQCLTLFNQFKHQTWTLDFGFDDSEESSWCVGIGGTSFSNREIVIPATKVHSSHHPPALAAWVKCQTPVRENVKTFICVYCWKPDQMFWWSSQKKSLPSGKLT